MFVWQSVANLQARYSYHEELTPASCCVGLCLESRPFSKHVEDVGVSVQTERCTHLHIENMDLYVYEHLCIQECTHICI